ncbi:MAG: hypothetical protein K2G52_04960 [Muribaculaceae bacterium]|nr:hypothetical protein [Muribaculaceae bacterium]
MKKSENKELHIKSDPGTDEYIYINLPAVNPEKTNPALTKLNKDDIRDLIAPMRKILANKKLKFSNSSDPLLIHIFSNLSDSILWNRLLKDELAEIYTSFCADIWNLVNIGMADKKLERTWREILFSEEVSPQAVEKILGRNIVAKMSWHWNSRLYFECLFSPLTFADDSSYYYSSSNRFNHPLSLYPEARKKLLEAFYGKETIAPEIFDKIPEDENFVISNFEQQMPSELNLLSGIGMTGNPLASSTGALTAAKLKSIKKSYPIDEFKPSFAKWHLDRTELMVTAYFLQDAKQTTSADPGKFAKFIIQKLPSLLKPANFGMLLPEFKGFTKSWAEVSNAKALTDTITAIIRPSADGWMSLSNLRVRVICGECSHWDHAPYHHLFPSKGRSRHSLKRKDDKLEFYESHSNNIRWFSEIDFPFVLHWLKLLCAVGILEIAETDNISDNTDNLEGLCYVRLTPLGRYALGIDQKYVATESVSPYELDFDEKNCIITILSDSCPYTLFLRQISSAIGSHRFRITPLSLIQGCSSQEDLEDRITKLQKLVTPERSETLKTIIEEARKRVGCVEPVNEPYVLFKIKPDIPGFVEFLSTNKEIRENVVFAQNSMILVRHGFLNKFISICNKNGYILN